MLNGQRVEFPVEADTEQGWVDMYRRLPGTENTPFVAVEQEVVNRYGVTSQQPKVFREHGIVTVSE